MVLLLFALFICPLRQSAAGQDIRPQSRLSRLAEAYPERVLSVGADTLYWRDGTAMPLGSLTLPSQPDTVPTTVWETLLNSATLRDQMEQRYQAADTVFAPARNHEPGRVRHEAFFRKMYGATEGEVRKNLVPIQWLAGVTGASVTLLVTRINGVDKRLRDVSEELERLPHDYRKYLQKIAGTFAWRSIAGTERVSVHSFGIAIDINVGFSDYWRWNGHGTSPPVYKNRIPIEIIRIFERHGFIWGGRWYHYDTMHFEYRPELL